MALGCTTRYLGGVPKVIKRSSEAGGPEATPSPAGRARKRIIEREVVGATEEARRILESAKAEAEAILGAARQEAESLRQSGYAEGVEQGKVEATETMTRGLVALRQMERGLEAEYIGLLRECVEKILQQELTQSPKAILSVVRGALLDARQQREVTVRVHPDDAELVEQNQARMLEVLARANMVTVRSDPGVQRGGCIVATELGLIDASLERQLDALVRAVNAELGESGAAEPYQNDGELDPEDEPGFAG